METKQEGLMNSFEGLVRELDRQQKAKRDFIADSGKVEMNNDNNELRLNLYNGNGDPQESFEIRETAHEQIAGKLQIPKTYYDRMAADSPELLTTNVNHWLHEEPKRYMVRTMDGQARALLSNRYRPLDNYDLAQAALPVLAQYRDDGLQIRDCGLTDRRLYIKATVQSLKAEVTVGDVVEAGIVISNSEIGCGSLRVEPMTFRLVCLNGMISATSIRQTHLGRKLGEYDDSVEEYFTDRTKALTDQAFWHQIQDVVKGTLGNGDWIKSEVIKYREAKEREIARPKSEVIEIVQKKHGFSNNEGEGILENFIKSGDFTLWGLANAVTRTAQDAGNYDRRIEMERIGNNIVELPKNEYEILKGE